jgi:uncharacterized protein Yka (UPF0111/DUF47 family)
MRFDTYILLGALVITNLYSLNNALAHADSHSEMKQQLERLEQKIDKLSDQKGL